MVDLAAVIGEQLECPICFQTPRDPPIFQCENGHLVCAGCKPKLANGKCPQGNCLLQRQRSRLAEKLLEKADLPRPCKYAVIGCFHEDKMATLPKHEADCGFRSVVCPDLDCVDRVAERDVLSHLIEEHAMIDLEKTLKIDKALDECLWVVNGDDCRVRSVDKTWPVSVFKCDGFVFFAVLTKPKSNGLWHAFLQMLAPKSLSETYSTEIRLASIDGDSSVVFNGSVHAVDRDSKRVIASGDCLSFTDAFVARLLRPFPEEQREAEDDDELKYLLKLDYSVQKKQ